MYMVDTEENSSTSQKRKKGKGAKERTQHVNTWVKWIAVVSLFPNKMILFFFLLHEIKQPLFSWKNDPFRSSRLKHSSLKIHSFFAETFHQQPSKELDLGSWTALNPTYTPPMSSVEILRILHHDEEKAKFTWMTRVTAERKKRLWRWYQTESEKIHAIQQLLLGPRKAEI